MLRKLDRLPTPTSVASAVIKAAAGVGQPVRASAMDKLAAMLAADPAMTAGLLKMANTLVPGSAQTAPQAIDKLGDEQLRSAVLSQKILIARDEIADSGLDLPAFLRHCIATAIAAEMVADRLDADIDTQQAFTCGLLHDIGKPVLALLLPKSYCRALSLAKQGHRGLTDVERKIIGLDHTVVGRRLAERWRLGQAIEQAIWMHHQPPQSIPDTLAHRALIEVVCLANMLAKRTEADSGNDYNQARREGQLAERLGLSGVDVERVLAALTEATEQRSNLLGLGSASQSQSHRQALRTANDSLGELVDELRRVNRNLVGKAEAFRSLQQMALDLPAAATVADALVGIANSAAEAIGLSEINAQCVVAYSMGLQDEDALVLRMDYDGQCHWNTIPTLNSLLSSGQPDRTNLPPEALQALLNSADQTDRRILQADYHHEPLLRAGVWAGGLLIPSDKTREAGTQTTLQIEALCEAMSIVLAAVQQRNEAVGLSEQLTMSAQSLSQAQQALLATQLQSAATEMASGAAHEINTPLAVISGRAQLMLNRATNEQDRRTWQLIADQAQHVSDLVSQLLESAQPGLPKPADMDAGQILHRAVDAFRNSDHPQAESANVDIDVTDQLPAAWVDGDQICTAVAALVANAAAATPVDGTVHMAAKPGDPSGMVLLTVSDDGHGMDAEMLEKAFVPFFSAQQAGRRPGLGLPTARRLIEANGGSIRLDSRPNRGTTVFVLLPVAR